MAAACYQEFAGGVRLFVRLIPRSSQTRVDRMRDGRLCVRVVAPPVEEAANQALIACIANWLDWPRRDITITRGGHCRDKTLEVRGPSPELLTRLARCLEADFSP
ncbi:MAG: DUF167 domain-containing protein [Candidatus Sericytochromatia bacterium]|nr:DUF167 domain-containing protein [Candidatus Sericytochromatia bacterium]